MSNTKNTNQKVTTITHEFFGNLDIIQAEGGFSVPKNRLKEEKLCKHLRNYTSSKLS